MPACNDVFSSPADLLIFIYVVFFLSIPFINNQQHSAEDSILNMLVEVERDLLYAQVRNKQWMTRKEYIYCFTFLFSCMQSITLPLQGFLNAIVYGWTRDDFVQEVVGNWYHYGSVDDHDGPPPPIAPEESDGLMSDSETEDEEDD